MAEGERHIPVEARSKKVKKLVEPKPKRQIKDVPGLVEGVHFPPMEDRDAQPVIFDREANKVMAEQVKALDELNKRNKAKEREEAEAERKSIEEHKKEQKKAAKQKEESAREKELSELKRKLASISEPDGKPQEESEGAITAKDVVDETEDEKFQSMVLEEERKLTHEMMKARGIGPYAKKKQGFFDRLFGKK